MAQGNNKLKKKVTLDKIKKLGIRKGDIVRVTSKPSQYRKGGDVEYGVVGEINGWWQLEHTIDVYIKGSTNIGTITDFDECVVVMKREDVLSYYDLIGEESFSAFIKKNKLKK